jgi:hypothetical protein
MSISQKFPVPFSVAARCGELLNAQCPSRDVLKHVSSHWGMPVLMLDWIESSMPRLTACQESREQGHAD